MKTLDSIWWHSSPQNGPLASSYVGIIFCALLQNDMIVSDLKNMEFDLVPDFNDRKLSPVEYCLAYTDGVIYEEYIVKKYREQMAALIESGELYEFLAESKSLSHKGNGAYTLQDSWDNVDGLLLELAKRLK